MLKIRVLQDDRSRDRVCVCVCVCVCGICVRTDDLKVSSRVYGYVEAANQYPILHAEGIDETGKHWLAYPSLCRTRTLYFLFFPFS